MTDTTQVVPTETTSQVVTTPGQTSATANVGATPTATLVTTIKSDVTGLLDPLATDAKAIVTTVKTDITREADLVKNYVATSKTDPKTKWIVVGIVVAVVAVVALWLTHII